MSNRGCRTPKCGTIMRVTYWEDDDGVTHKNWACPKCGSVQATVNFTGRTEISGGETNERN